MAGVTVDSGEVVATMLSRYVPREQWKYLVKKRKDYLAVQISYDCRCLVQFIKDAEEMWEPLGYASADDLIVRGYELEPEEIRLAVRWLELNEPEAAVGLEEVKALTARERSREAAGLTTEDVVPKKTGERTDLAESARSQAARAAAAGVSRDTQKKLDALARKAPEKLAEVQRGEKSTNRACIEAGIVKEKTPRQWLAHWWAKATEEERSAFLDEIGSQILKGRRR